MEKIQFKLEVFEGPLDLLLALIGKKKIEIWDINISDILEQYLAYLEKMREMNLEIASEFLSVASNLIYIKSRMLLPMLEEPAEEDPRADLVRMLQEYQKYKEISAILSQRLQTSETRYTKFPDVLPEQSEKYDFLHELIELRDAFERVLQRNDRKLPPPMTTFTPLIGKEVVSVSSKLSYILNKLISKKVLSFLSLFKSVKSRSEIIAVFLAVLELTKSNKINVTQQDDAIIGEYTIEIAKTGGD